MVWRTQSLSLLQVPGAPPVPPSAQAPWWTTITPAQLASQLLP
jgi:hypothetical protein